MLRVLAGLAYRNTADEPGHTPRTVHIRLVDGLVAASAYVHVDVVTFNDHTPVFRIGPPGDEAGVPPPLRIVEEQPFAFLVNVTDADVGVGAAIAYRILSGDDGGRLHLDPATGVLRGNPVADREDMAGYTLVIQARNTEEPFLSAEITLVVVVEDINDNDPVYAADTPRFVLVSEQAEMGFVVVEFTATDLDAGVNAQRTFSIGSGNTLGHFAIDAQRGELRVAAPLDREAVPAYRLTVTVTDGGVPARQTNHTLDIVLRDENEAPVFEHASYSGNFAEDAPIGYNVINVTARDMDVGPNRSTFAFSIDTIVDGAGQRTDGFAVDPVSGRITTTRVHNRELQDAFTLTVLATDMEYGNRLSGTAIVNLRVLDVNDNAPVFDTVKDVKIAEDADTGTTLLVLRATDADDGPNAAGLRFRIAASLPPGAPFAVDPITGVVSLTNGTDLDRERISEYVLVFAVIDGGVPQLERSLAVPVTIQDVNDNTPLFLDANVSAAISEDSPPGTLVTTVSATDLDAGKNGLVVYSLEDEGNVGGAFVVDRNTGQVSTAMVVDREARETYTLQVGPLPPPSPGRCRYY